MLGTERPEDESGDHDLPDIAMDTGYGDLGLAVTGVLAFVGGGRYGRLLLWYDVGAAPAWLGELALEERS